MDLSTVIGIVGGEGMSPKETKRDDGKLFRHCGLLIHDPFGRVRKDDNGEDIRHNGQLQRERKIMQLVFSSEERHRKLFSKIKTGRKIAVNGRRSERPRVAEWSPPEGRPNAEPPKGAVQDPTSGKWYVAYANTTLHVEEVEFLDRPLKSSVDRHLNAAVKAGTMSKEEAKSHSEAIVGQLSSGSSLEEPEAETPAGDDDAFA